MATYRGGDQALELGDESLLRQARGRAEAPISALIAGQRDPLHRLQRRASAAPEAAKRGRSQHLCHFAHGRHLLCLSFSGRSPFVKVGDKVEKNTVVCIIEAMKVMNEIKAGVTGLVAEMLVESGHPVEFGTKLFRMTRSDIYAKSTDRQSRRNRRPDHPRLPRSWACRQLPFILKRMQKPACPACG